MFIRLEKSVFLLFIRLEKSILWLEIRLEKSGNGAIYMYKRKIETELIQWKESLKTKRKAFVLKGLRQTGKTTSIKDFANNNYENVVYINFKLEPSLKNAFNGDLDVNTITTNISALKPAVKFVPYKTVIILDEVQESSGARAAIKSFVENDNRYDVIASGSLLGLKGYNQKYHGGASIGYEHIVYMKPMDFEEFLLAKGVSEDVITYLRTSFESRKNIRQPIHEAMSRYFKEYLCVGGMPEAVDTFLKTNDLNQVREVLSDILEGYKDDYGKHLNENEEEKLDKALLAKINKVYTSIPAQLAKENKKFMYSKISKKATSTMYDPAIQWLVDYGLLTYCYNLRQLELPLTGNKIEECFKLYVADTGLFMAMLEKDVYEDVLFGKLGSYKGALYENIIADAFAKSGKDLFYYSKESGLEIDFITRYKKDVSLVEVKAKTGKTKAAKTVLSNKKDYPEVNRFIKFGEFNIEELTDEFGNIRLVLPHYLAFLIASSN